MTLAAVGAVLIGNAEEGALLILIFAGAHFLEEYVEEKSRKSLTALLQMNPTQARLIQENGKSLSLEVTDLKWGYIRGITWRPSTNRGASLQRQLRLMKATITGESMPRSKGEGDSVFASTVNISNRFENASNCRKFRYCLCENMKVVENAQHSMKTSNLYPKIEPIYVNHRD